MKYGVRNRKLKYGMHNMEFEIRNMKYGTQNIDLEI